LKSVEDEDLEAIRKTGGRWAILRCLYEVLCDMRLDLSRSIQRDFEVARSIIETGCRRIRDADILLDWVESKLVEKAICLDKLDLWEDLLKKAKKGQLTREDIEKVPLMKNLIEKYEFISYCIPIREPAQNQRVR